MKIEVGKTYRVMNDYRTRGNYNKGDLLEITYIDKDVEYNRVDFLYNGTKSDFDSLEWIEKMALEEVEPSKPAHYDTAIDTIAFAKANFSREAVEGFMRINAVKYIQRYDKKNGVEDIRKAIVYLNMLLEHVEGEEE